MSAGAEHQSGKPRNFSASDLEVLQQLPEYVSSMWPGYLSHKFGVCDRLLSRVISELPGASSLSSITQSVNEQASLKHKQRELAFMSLQEAGSKNPFWARVNKARKLARWVWRLHCIGLPRPYKTIDEAKLPKPRGKLEPFQHDWERVEGGLRLRVCMHSCVTGSKRRWSTGIAFLPI